MRALRAAERDTPMAWRGMSQSMAGYVLLELLVSAAVVCAILGVVLRLAASAHTAVQTEGDQADLQQRLRVAVEAMRRDLLSAGAGPSSGTSRAPLIDVFAPVLPARSGAIAADPELSYQPDRLSVFYVPGESSQTQLLAGMAGAGDPLAIAGSAPGCPAGNVCGFNAGDRVLIYAPANGDGARDLFTIGSLDQAQGLLLPEAPLTRPYPAGSRVATVVQRVYYLDRAGKRLMVYDGDRSDVPVVDHVVDLRFTYYADPAPWSVTPPAAGGSSCAYAPGSPPVPLLASLGGVALVALTAAQLTDGPVCGQAPARFDADLLRVRRINVMLRLETEGTDFRGTGAAFANRGTSLVADRYIPDVQVTFDVTPRNFLNTGVR